MSHLARLLVQQSELHGDRTAIGILAADLSLSESLTFAQLYARAHAIARLTRPHVRPGDRVLLAFANDLEAVQLFWACMVAGAVAIPAPAPELRPSNAAWRRLQAVCEDAQVSLAFTRGDLLEAARANVPQVVWSSLDELGDWRQAASAGEYLGLPPESDSPEPLAYLQYTSGSTSQPKGVMVSHANVLAQCAALTSLDPELAPAVDRSLVWLPWFHDYGLIHGLLMPMYSGGTSLLMPTQPFLLNPLVWLEAIAAHGVTHSGAPNFAFEACTRALARQPSWTADLRRWRVATCGAEPVRPSTMERFQQAFAPHGLPPSTLRPSYGLAEAVLGVTASPAGRPPRHVTVHADRLQVGQAIEPCAPAERGTLSLTSCGPTLHGFTVKIVDPERLVELPEAHVGEVWVSGPSVGKGYWHNGVATEATFDLALAGSNGGSGFMRTGDLGFLLQGELHLTGRIKDLILLNGRNVYPQDLEFTAESAHPRVRPEGVIAFGTESAQGEELVLLVESRGTPTPGVVRDMVEAVMQAVSQTHDVGVAHIVPLRFGSLPKTSSGKPQRALAKRMFLAGDLQACRLNDLEPSAPALSDTPAAPTGLADELARLWSDVLQRPDVTPDAHFLQLGGDSLTGTQLLSRVRTRWGIDLPMSAFFSDPTLRGMARTLEERLVTDPSRSEGGEANVPPAAEPPGAGGPAPLSYSQERMWFMHQLAPGSSAYHVPLALRLSGQLDTQALEQALAALVRHHEILRTRFPSTDLGPVAEALDHQDIPLTRLDAPHEDGDRALDDLLTRLSQQPFDLERGPLLRTWLIRTAEDEHVLLLVLHHIVADQWSFSVLGKDLSTAYRLVRTTGSPDLPAPHPRYADYARWHRRWFEAERQQRDTAYWTERLQGLHPVALVPDRTRPRQPTLRGASVRLDLPVELSDALNSLAARHDATLAMALLALFKVFLFKHTGQSDLAVGMPIANRHHPSSEALIGTLVNTLVVRTSLDGDPDFLDILRRVKTSALEAYEHQDMPFELLVRNLDRQGDPSRPPLFNVMFNVVNTPVREVAFDGVRWSRINVDRRAAQADLTVVFDPQFDRSIVLEYATDLFEAPTIRRMGEQLLVLLRSVADHARVPVSRWSPLDAAQRLEMIGWGSGREAPLPSTALADLLVRGLRADPEAVAIAFGDGRMTCRELDLESDRLAQHLHRMGLGDGSRIGLCLPRSPTLVVALLGTIRSGATYVPLDPGYPKDRIAHQVEDAGLSLVIGTADALKDHDAIRTPRLIIDQPWPEPESEAPGQASGNGPAYLIYTSGSTGRPKGVTVPQAAVVNFLQSMAREPGLHRGDRVLAVTTLGFDIAVLELLLPISVGATIVLASDAEASDGRALARLIRDHGVTLLQATPSRWQLLLDTGWSGHRGLRALVGGEPLSPALAKALVDRCDGVWNMYGPTETTVWSSAWRVRAETPVSLGLAIDNTRILVLDEAGQMVPAGAWGEIWIGGAGVADGYWQRPELSAYRFRRIDPRQGGDGRRFYRTGDRGRWRHDGSLEHGGRLDSQVKLRGFRIELGEVEACIGAMPGVQRCVAVVREDQPGDQRLVAYVVATTTSPEPETLRQRARQWLPDHMVPSHVMAVPELPLLPNGKTDLRSLPRPHAQPLPASVRVAPRSDTEQRLWVIWQELLGHGGFGVEDSFFDLGGHSMLAVRLIRRVESEFLRPFNLTALLEQPTIAAMVRQIEQPEDLRDRPVVTLRQGAPGTPALFLLAGARMYQELARRLDVDLPVYGLFSQTEIDLLEWPVDQALPPVSVDALANEYLDLIRAQQPHGPYRLGGYSIGGVLAYEVAQRLQRQGEEVSLLVMLDCALPGHGWRHLRAGIVRRLRIFRRDGLAHLKHLYRQVRLQQAASQDPGGRRIQAYAQAIRLYRARPGAFPMAFFQAAGDASTEPAYGWRSLVPTVVIERISGNHIDILDMPHVADLARRLSRHLSSDRQDTTEEPRAPVGIEHDPVALHA